MGLPAGQLNRRVRILKPTGALDEANQPLDTWEQFKSPAWVNMKSPTGLATIQADGVTENRPRISIRFRYRIDLDISMRLEWIKTGIVFEIEDIKSNHDRQDWTDCVCRELSNGS